MEFFDLIQNYQSPNRYVRLKASIFYQIHQKQFPKDVLSIQIGNVPG